MKKLVLVLVAVLVLSYGWYRFSLRPVDGADQTRRQVTVASGLSTRQIASLLKDQGIIRAPWAFSLYATLHRTQGGLQAGDFYLQPSMDVPQVIEALKRGFSEEMSLTVPEGFTVSDIDALLAEKDLLPAGAFAACARTCDVSAYAFLPPASVKLAPRGGRVEGYLYPDTYFVTREGFTAKDFLDRMLGNFRTRVADGLSADIKASGKSLADIVTMASLVEKETRTDGERPVVAGILWKRLGAGITLGVDAAVRYVVQKPTAALTQADLQTNSPYNLRVVQGLPPGPIASPGLESLKAALHPQASSHLFYLHGSDGVIHYADTNDEHNANRARYLQ